MARVTVCDMLSPLVRLQREVEVTRASELLAELRFDADLSRPVLVRNGVVMDPEVDFEILDTDFISVQLVPKKDALRAVALIAAVAVATAVIGPWAAGVIGWTTKVGVAVMTAAAVAATSALVNAVLPPSVADRESGGFGDRSNNYGWQARSNTALEGDAVPRLFGELTFAPKLISRYIETIDDKQYFNGLYLVNDGPVDWIDSIRLNQTDYANFEGVSVETRYGAVDQPVISSFNAIRSDTPVGTKLEHGVNVEATTSGNQVETIRINLTFPNGLYKIDMDGKDAGEQENAQWTVHSAYSSNGGASWADFLPPQVYNANTRTPLRRTLVRSGLARGSYMVRVLATYDTNDGGSQHPSEVWFDFLQEETSDALTYPGRSLLSVKALATDKLNGSEPLVECRARSGGSNPADICLVMLDECNVPSSKIDLEVFAEWRQDCVDRSFACDIIFDTVSSLRECLDMVSLLGRARVEKFGSRWSVIMDKPGQLPQQGFTFGMGNIDKGSFGIDTIPMTNRANVVDVTYYPDSNRNQKKSFEVASASYNTDEQERRASLNLVGCKSLDQATRHANFLLRCNRYLTLMPYWGVDLEAIQARVGDIVTVSHDIPQWGWSGLVVSGSVDGVVLDREVEMEVDKRYGVQIRDADDNTIFERVVSWVAGPTSSLTFVTPAPVAPVLHDNYSFGEVGKTSKLVRLTAVQTTGVAMQRKLVSLEYVPEVYEDGATVVPEEIAAMGISRFTVTDFIRYAADKTIETVLWASWHGSAMSYTFSWRGPSDRAFRSVVVHDAVAEVVVRETGLFVVRVDDGRGHVVEQRYTVVGKLAPPSNVPWMLVEDGRITIGAVKDIDLAGYRFRYNYGTNTDWAPALPMHDGLWTTTLLPVPANLYGEITILVKAVDTSGVESDRVASYTVNLGSYEPSNVLALYDQDADDWPGTLVGGTLDPHPKADGDSVLWSDDPNARLWSDNPNDTLWVDRFASMSYETPLIELGVDYPGAWLALDYEFAGSGLLVEYRRVGDGPLWTSPDDTLWTSDDDPLWDAGEYMPWPGRVAAVSGAYQFRLTTLSGVVQGQITSLMVMIDADDITEYLDDVTISVDGTRLPIQRSYRSISQVHPVIVGGSGRFVEIVDKSTSGPMVRISDGTTYVTGVIDAIIKGSN